METREEILKELKEIAPTLSALQKVNFYQLPVNYFANFQLNILDLIDQSVVTEELKGVAPNLAKLQKQSALEVPAHYFNGFSKKLMSKIQAVELADIAPALSSLQKENVFEVPVNYFSAFPKVMLNKIAVEPKSEIATTPKWIQSLNRTLDNVILVIFRPKYSLAFSGFATTLIVAAMMFSQFNSTQRPCSDALCMLEKVSNDDLNAFIENNSDDFSTDVLESSTDDNKVLNHQTKNLNENVLNQLSEEELNSAILD